MSLISSYRTLLISAIRYATYKGSVSIEADSRDRRATNIAFAVADLFVDIMVSQYLVH